MFLNFKGTSIFLTLLSIIVVENHSEKLDIDPSKTIVWGPGLNPEKVILKARYIFLQLRDSVGQK